MSRRMPFVKMQSVGNDFVLVEECHLRRDPLPLLARRLCDRRSGVGGDGLLVVGRSEKADFRFRMFNPDGTEDHCGNGLRCAVKHWVERHSRAALDEGLVWVRVEHLHGVSEARAKLRKRCAGRITIGMGTPTFDPKKIPVASERELLDAPVLIAGRKLRISCVSTGTAHTVILVKKSPLGAPVPEVSRLIETAPLFPGRTSVLWTYVRSRSRLELGIWERGVGETLGCGTGACAAAATTARLGLTGRKVAVDSKGGRLVVEIADTGEVLLSGEAVEVFSAVWVSGGI